MNEPSASRRPTYPAQKLFWSLMAVSVLIAGCSTSPDQPADNPCPSKPHPTFTLTLRAQNTHVPADTWLNIKYGSGEERFEVAHPEHAGDAVFCKLQRASAAGNSDAGPHKDAAEVPAGPITSVVCDLWTDGPATLTSRGGNYPLLKQDLVPKKNDCGIEQTAVEAILQYEDAGQEQ